MEQFDIAGESRCTRDGNWGSYIIELRFLGLTCWLFVGNQ